MREIDNVVGVAVQVQCDLFRLLVRALQEGLQQAEFVKNLHRGGVDRVTAEITQEVGMLFEDGHVYALARQEVAKHHARRPAPGDATARLDTLTHARHRSFCQTCNVFPLYSVQT